MGFDLNLEGSCLACISNLDGRYLGKLLLCVASWQCVMTRKTRCCQEGHGTRGLFLGGGESGRRAAPPRPTPHFSHQPAWVKSKMAPRGAVEGQVGRWVPDTLWHVCAKSPIMSGLDSVHFVGEGLTWQVGRDANDHFLHLFFFFFHPFSPWKPKVGRQKLLKHSWLWDKDACLWAGWRTCDWHFFMTELAENMQTNRRGQSQHVGNLGKSDEKGHPAARRHHQHCRVATSERTQTSWVYPRSSNYRWIQ